ncbi:MAG: hypothetical protein ACREP8_09030 [Candidatus Binatia bacterium]
MTEPRRPIPEPTYHWPGGPTADDEPTPLESALAALKIGAILAATVTIVFFYLATYGGVVAGRTGPTLAVLAAFILPSVIAFLRTLWARRRRPPES